MGKPSEEKQNWVILILCTMHPLLFCTMTNKCTIISQIITLLHVSTLSCHPQGACNQYLDKLHKYFKCSCWNLNCKLYYRQLHLKYLCNLSRYWLQAVWGWHDSVETCSSVIICEIIVHLLVIVNPVVFTDSCIWNTCVTCQGIDYKLSEDDTMLSKHVAVW
jgi:hypothetical protein